MKAFLCTLAAFAALSGWSPVCAQQAMRPTIRVEFVIEAPAYLLSYTASEENLIRSRAAAELARQANANFGFASFSSSAGTHRLIFTLANANRFSPSLDDEVGLFVELVGAGNPRPYYWRPVRQAQYADIDPGSVDNLLSTIKRAGETADWTAVATRFLTRISIAGTATINPQQPLRWILPFTGQQLCMASGSEIQIDADLTLAGTVVNSSYRSRASGWDPPSARARGHIIAIPAPNNALMAELQRAANANRVTARAIYVVRYIRDHTACAPIVR